MAERSIIFSAPMIRALMDGQKTQTRRIAWRRIIDPADSWLKIGRKATAWQSVRPGNRLWVREAWNLFARSQDGEEQWPVTPIPRADPRLDDEQTRGSYVLDYATCGIDGYGPWRSPIHMPRWGSRITLTVTHARVQRLQDITEDDAVAEGMASTICLPQSPTAPPMRGRFASLWDHLHGPGAWDANPEVVALTFTCQQAAP